MPLAPPRRTRRLSRRALLTGWAPIVALVSLPLGLSSCINAPPPVASIDTASRLDALDAMAGPTPTTGTAAAAAATAAATPADALGHDLTADVEILWDEWLIPAIVATSEDDLAYALGVVHVHLRWGQMELIKRIARGRLAEIAGPVALPIDRGLRTLQLDRAVPAIEAGLPEETRRWLEHYAAGVNRAKAMQPDVHADVRAMGIDPAEPWTVGDTLAIARLASADLTWGRWLSLLSRRDADGYDDFVARLRAFAAAGVPSFGPGQPVPLSEVFQYGRTGSNSVVVAGSRTATGAALIASDPHLGLPQPNIWMIAALHGPRTTALGLTIPGLPFVLVGRNERIAWGGTNMQAVASQLVDVSEEDPASFTERTERIGVRWWIDATLKARESRFGPVMTDISLLDGLEGPGGTASALRWRGHEPSDETTPFLRAMRASDWPSFRAAFASFRTGAQNMLYADADGNIGQLLATEWVPAAAATAWRAPIDPADTGDWSERIGSGDLPVAVDPPGGVIASANNTPILTDPPIVSQGNSNDRLVRMQELLAGDGTITVDQLKRLQLDTFSRASLEAARLIVALSQPDEADEGDAPKRRATVLLATLEAWDGRYDADSTGAVAYMRILDALVDDLYDDRYAAPLRSTLRSAPYLHAFVAEDLAAASEEAASAVREAVDAAARGFDPEQAWGDIHRLPLKHPLGNVPLLGRPWDFGDRPTGGTTTTILKSAHRVTATEHETTFGANARHVSDLSDPDANWFVLVGGQDGRPGSEHLLDQVDRWLDGEMIRVPLTESAWRERARRVTTLRSAPGPAP